MVRNELGKYTKSFGLSFAITSFLSALLVLLKETHEHTVMEWMKTVTLHHWVTHGLINLVVFILLGVALSKPNNGEGVNISTNTLVICIVGSVVISGILIAGFYR
jgi:lipoprotein signal peptidase